MHTLFDIENSSNYNIIQEIYHKFCKERGLPVVASLINRILNKILHIPEHPQV